MGEPSPLPTKIRDIAGPGDLQWRVRMTVIMARIVEEQAKKERNMTKSTHYQFY
jgi:hypothetical protein